MTNQVEDRKVETRIQVGNILSALILAAILWVGSTIEELKTTIADMSTRQQVNITLLNYHSEQITELKDRVKELENKGGR